MKVTISGFYDEVSTSLDKQIELAKELGESYICPRSVDGKNIADYTYEEFMATVKPRLDKAGIKFSSIGSPIGKVGVEDEEGFNKQLTQLATLIKIAEAMECKYIRMFSFFIPEGKDPKDYRDIVMDKLKKFVALTEGTDVVLLHENEKEIYGDTYERCLDIYHTLDTPKLKLIFDASNYIQVGCDPNEAYLATRNYTVYYHMKDCDKETRVEFPLGLGSTDYPAIFADLEARGYNGFMTLEPHTGKYAVGRKFMYFVPFASKLKPEFYTAFRKIDAKLGYGAFKRVTRKDMFVMQYKNLKKFISEAEK